MTTTTAPPATGSIEAAAARLAALLTGGGSSLADADPHSDLEFEAVIGLRPLARSAETTVG